MLAVLITLTPGRRNEFIDCQQAKVHIAVLTSMDLKTWWNSTLELLELAYQIREFTRKCSRNLECSDFRPLFTMQDEWTSFRYIMEVSRTFRYWTLWISQWHMVSLNHVITVWNDMFDHIDGIMQHLAKKKTQWKEDLYFTVNIARQKLYIYDAKVTPMTGMILISACILNPFWMLWSFRKWGRECIFNLEDKTLYTTQY